MMETRYETYNVDGSTIIGWQEALAVFDYRCHMFPNEMHMILCNETGWMYTSKTCFYG